MKALFAKYKSVIRFILTFLLVYVTFSVCYHVYLNISEGSKFYPDYITNLVARQSETLLNAMGYNTKLEPHPNEPSLKVILEGQYLARVIEGCNSISVIILFFSFIMAFSGRPKTTFFYILSGSVLIYAANIIRIVLLSIWLYHYPGQKELLHTVVFPGIIYGFMFLLWIFWVNRFSKLKPMHD